MSSLNIIIFFQVDIHNFTCDLGMISYLVVKAGEARSSTASSPRDTIKL